MCFVFSLSRFCTMARASQVLLMRAQTFLASSAMQVTSHKSQVTTRFKLQPVDITMTSMKSWIILVGASIVGGGEQCPFLIFPWHFPYDWGKARKTAIMAWVSFTYFNVRFYSCLFTGVVQWKSRVRPEAVLLQLPVVTSSHVACAQRVLNFLSPRYRHLIGYW